jgi:pSer/pThr/pTyr-binding forkhead associated (FHA) protein
MPKLSFQFGTTVLKEYSLRAQDVTIGRAPQSSIVIDNPAVSYNHAKIFWQDGAYYVQDLGSLNGTFLNGNRVTQAPLSPGDTIAVGKHTVRFLLERPGEAAEAVAAPALSPGAGVAKLDGTMILDTKLRREVQQRMAAPGAAPGKVAEAKKVGKLTVVQGKTTAKEYLLASPTSIVGKSEGAAVRLKGWFAPKVAAIINKQGESYFVSPTSKKAFVNGQPVTGRQELKDGDVLTLGKVHMQFNLVAW